jgi:hypothetical protein
MAKKEIGYSIKYRAIKGEFFFWALIGHNEC